MTGQLVFDPVHVLGCTPDEATRLLAGRRVTPGEAEALALVSYDIRKHAADPHSYWVTIGQAARILRLSPVAVREHVEAGGLPHVWHESGVPLMRRHEVEERARLVPFSGSDPHPRPRAHPGTGRRAR